MKSLRKIFFTLVLLSVFITSFASCDRKYDEAEVIAAANTLIRKSEVIEDILFGEGISPEEIGVGVGYKKTDKNHVKLLAEKMGESFTDINGLKAVISRVYTAGYANDIFTGVLYGSVDSNTRYYQDGEDIMVDTNYKQRKTDYITYHYHTLRVKDVDGEKITVTIDVTISTKDGKKSQNRSIDIDMLEEATGWKLDTPTFAVYNENYDKYKELENELNKR